MNAVSWLKKSTNVDMIGLGKRIHWEVCRENGIEVKTKWYEHQPEVVQENERYKILWDLNVQTDQVIEARRPDILSKIKKTKFRYNHRLCYSL